MFEQPCHIPFQHVFGSFFLLSTMVCLSWSFRIPHTSEWIDCHYPHSQVPHEPAVGSSSDGLRSLVIAHKSRLWMLSTLVSRTCPRRRSASVLQRHTRQPLMLCLSSDSALSSVVDRSVISNGTTIFRFFPCFFRFSPPIWGLFHVWIEDFYFFSVAMLCRCLHESACRLRR